MGSTITLLALPLTAVVVLKATTFQVGLLASAATAAFALIALPAGAIVDRYVKRRIMIVCDLARMLIIGSVPVAAAAGALTMGQLYAVAITAGVCTVFFDVCYQSYLPVVVGPGQLLDGNGKLGATQSFAEVTGPGLGGGLVGVFGVAMSLAADAISYAVSVASLLAIRVPEKAPPKADRRTLRAEIAEGLSFVVSHPILRRVVACTGTANLFSGVQIAMEIIFLVRVLHVRPAYTGLIIAIASVGGVIGGVLSGTLSRRIGSARIIWVSILVFGLPQLLLPLAYPGWRVAVCPPELLGRMNAATRWIVWGTLPLGGLLGGALGAGLGVRPTIWIAYAGSWAAGWWVFFSPLRRLRDFLTGGGIPQTPSAPQP